MVLRCVAMNQVAAKVIFRLRSKINDHWAAGLRTLYWKSLGLRAGEETLLSKISATWPHQVSLGKDCRLEHGLTFKFDGVWQPGPCLVFGDHVFIGEGCEFNIRTKLTVGSYVLIASGCKFIDHNHGFASRLLPMAKQLSEEDAPIIIEDDVWFGVNVTVLKGVTIRRGAIIAAGAVLTQSVGEFEIWGGVPARKLRDRPHDERRAAEEAR